jgi:hypothetical protein
MNKGMFLQGIDVFGHEPFCGRRDSNVPDGFVVLGLSRPRLEEPVLANTDTLLFFCDSENRETDLAKT